MRQILYQPVAINVHRDNTDFRWA